MTCIYRTCRNCGVDRFVAFFQPLLEDHVGEIETYQYWVRTNKVNPIGKEVVMMMPVACTFSATLLVTDLSMYLENLAKHLFVARWQQDQFPALLNDVLVN